MLWDTAGQEEFDAITKAYYRGKTPPHCDRYTTAALGHWPPWTLRLPFYLSHIFLVDLQCIIQPEHMHCDSSAGFL